MLGAVSRPAGPKVAAVAERLAARIAAGDYLSTPLPSEHALAAETGVSYLTARRAVTALIGRGLLRREPHGRLLVADGEARPLMLGFVVPTLSSFDVLRWQQALVAAVAAAPRLVAVRTAVVSGWEDPALAALLARADGVVLYPGPWDPAAAPAVLARARARVVAVDRDLSGLGLPSLQPIPPAGVDALCWHLHGRGRRRIACAGPGNGDLVRLARIARWQAWVAANGCDGGLIDAAAPPAAADAVIAVSLPDALAVLRAARQAGRRVPEDLALAVVNDEGLGATLVPALTAIAGPDPATHLRQVLDWFAGGGPWTGPLVLQPDPITVAIREST